jgi:hypothetical protein
VAVLVLSVNTQCIFRKLAIFEALFSLCDHVLSVHVSCNIALMETYLRIHSTGMLLWPYLNILPPITNEDWALTQSSKDVFDH